MSRRKSKQQRAMVEQGKKVAKALADAGLIAANTPVTVIASGRKKSVTAAVKEAKKANKGWKRFCHHPPAR